MSEHEEHTSQEDVSKQETGYKESESNDVTEAVDAESKNNSSQDTVEAVPEETDEINSEANVQAEAEEVLADLQAKNEELEDRTLRLQAEINNIQKRNARDRSLAAKYRSQNLASGLLEVLDNLERALATPTTSEDAQALKQGVEMVHKQFIAAFDKENISVVDPLGEEFDPNLHQAISVMPGGEEYPANTVMKVLQKGYQLEDRILRPAMVIVAEENSNSEDK